jgi:hypothetical protein
MEYESAYARHEIAANYNCEPLLVPTIARAAKCPVLLIAHRERNDASAYTRIQFSNKYRINEKEAGKTRGRVLPRCQSDSIDSYGNTCAFIGATRILFAEESPFFFYFISRYVCLPLAPPAPPRPTRVIQPLVRGEPRERLIVHGAVAV